MQCLRDSSVCVFAVSIKLVQQASRGPMGLLRWPGIQAGEQGQQRGGGDTSRICKLLCACEHREWGCVCATRTDPFSLEAKEGEDLAPPCVYAVCESCVWQCVLSALPVSSVSLCVSVFLSLGHVPSFATG